MAMLNIVKLERPLKALANRRRLAIVAHIKKRREASVGDIADAVRLSIKATSKHLGVLYSADILEREQRNVHMFYRISKEVPEVTRGLLAFL